MNKSFRTRLKRIIMLGTIIPIVCFVLLFAYKFLSINIEAEKILFKEEYNNLENQVNQIISNKLGLLNTSMNFLTDDILFDEKSSKLEYLNRLILNSDVMYYVYSDDDEQLTNMKTIKLVNGIERYNDYLYIGNGELTLVFDFNKFYSDVSKYLDDSYTYQISYDENILIDELNRTSYSSKIKWRYFNKEMVYFDSKKDSKLMVSLRQDISREINSFYKSGFIFLLLFIVFILLMLKVVSFSSKSLLRPLNKLIDTVSNTAKDCIEVKNINIIEDEYTEIYESFDMMIHSVNNNIQMLKQQSEEINEKNLNMVDMNEQLEESLINLENSTNELEILGKQSKILVDHIKDLMWVIDSKGRIIYINNVVSDKLGYDVEELLGVKLEHILFRDYKNEEAYQEIFFADYESIDLTFISNNREQEEIFSCSTKREMQNDKLIKIQGVCKDITEERFIEVQMAQKNKISSTLNEISEILTRPEKLEFLLKHIVIRIERLLDPLICTIRLVDDSNRLELKAGIGECYNLVQEKYLHIDKDISGRAIKEGKIIIISDKKESDYHNYNEVFSIIDRSTEQIFLPLEYDGTTIGVMSICLRNYLSDADLKILKVFTNQASAAIEKARMYEEIESNYLNIIKALASTVEAKDVYTENHSIRVSMYSRMIAEELGLSDEEVGYIDIAGLLHDIGKIGISDLTLTKKGRLTDDEFHQIKKHPLNGGRIVSEMKLHPYIIEGVLYHHKRFDLKGYPDIDIDSLPISARIIGVADAFDAMTSNRSYQAAKTFNEALQELVQLSGTQFCPEIVKIMKIVIKKIERIAS